MEAIERAQRELRTSTPSLRVDGVWGKRTRAAYLTAPGNTRARVDVILEQGHAPTAAVLNGRVGSYNIPHMETVGRMSQTKFAEYAIAAGIKGDSLINFLTTVKHESNFEPRAENHRYTPERARQMFKGFASWSDAAIRELVAQGPEAFFEQTYGPLGISRRTARQLGNTTPGDGGKYYGRGIFMLTGRWLYAEAGAALGADLIGHPELLLTDLDLSCRSAVWYWKRFVQARGADRSIEAATRVVNRGLPESEVAARSVTAKQLARNYA